MTSPLLERRCLAVAVSLTSALLPLLLAGCAGLTTSTATPDRIAGIPLQGKLYGGQQPVANSTITLYAAGTSGYAASTQNILTKSVLTDGAGNFNITGDYTCTAGQQFYIVATGGNPGAGSNPNLAIIAALGNCSSLSASTFINMNEVTTVAAAYALSPFMTGYTNAGSSATNTAGLARAFVSANKLANTSTGVAGGPSLAPGAVIPTAELNTLANILAACINSTGGAAGQTNACGTLFTNATPPGGSAPSDTIAAILNIAKNPATNVTNLYNLSSATAPFQPQLSSAPNDWTVSINYTLGGFAVPAGVTADGSGRILFPNAGNNTVTILAQTGAAATSLTGNGLNAPGAIAIDPSGNAWVTNKAGNSVSAFTSTGGTLTGSPFTGNANLNGPVALAFDASGNLFVVNNTGNSITQLGGNGTFIQQVTSNVTAPSAIAIDPK